MIIIKSPREVELMRKAGHVVALVFQAIEPLVQPGVSTQTLNDVAEKVIRDAGGIPTELGYYGYPASVCLSVNEVLIHGIPSPKIILKDGDIVSLDLCATLNGYVGDAARTYPVGICSERALRMIKIAETAFYNGVSKVHAGAHLGDVEHAIEETVKANGCSVPRDYTGHGIGTHMHEDPYIPNYGEAGTGPILEEGMTLAIEPMVLEGRPEVRTLKDGWTVVAKDGKLTSHYENTIVVTKDGYEILTKL
ncbi:MAG: Methionine aminopeptidase 1 [Tenericutes bacterium ADurb.BinA155]|jgi:methionyl aminopeptidase|nr:MAG: Methionine aminopeptidase 1 [Tenericutes bacterium ADurb.BinA155]